MFTCAWKRPGECLRCHRQVLGEGVWQQLEEMGNVFIMEIIDGWNQENCREQTPTDQFDGESRIEDGWGGGGKRDQKTQH